MAAEDLLHLLQCRDPWDPTVRFALQDRFGPTTVVYLATTESTIAKVDMSGTESAACTTRAATSVFLDTRGTVTDVFLPTAAPMVVGPALHSLATSALRVATLEIFLAVGTETTLGTTALGNGRANTIQE